MSNALTIQTRLLTAEEAAQYLSVSPKSLETWRTRGGGPTFVRLRSRAIRYRLSDLADFVEQGLRASTSDPGPLSSQQAHRLSSVSAPARSP